MVGGGPSPSARTQFSQDRGPAVMTTDFGAAMGSDSNVMAKLLAAKPPQRYTTAPLLCEELIEAEMQAQMRQAVLAPGSVASAHSPKMMSVMSPPSLLTREESLKAKQYIEGHSNGAAKQGPAAAGSGSFATATERVPPTPAMSSHYVPPAFPTATSTPTRGGRDGGADDSRPLSPRLSSPVPEVDRSSSHTLLVMQGILDEESPGRSTQPVPLPGMVPPDQQPQLERRSSSRKEDKAPKSFDQRFRRIERQRKAARLLQQEALMRP